MARERQPTLSEAEREVLKVLWERGPSTVREVLTAAQGQGRSWAYNTVLTLLQRLGAKGYAAVEAGGLAHVFRAVVSREALLERRLGDLADELCEGEASPLMLALVKGRRFTPEEIAEFRRLLARLEREGPPRDRGR